MLKAQPGPCPQRRAPSALVPTSLRASTGVALPGVGAVPQRGAVSVGALGSAGAAQPQLPGSGEAKEVLVVRTKCRSKGWPGRALVLSSSPLSLWRDRSHSEPCIVALASYPSSSACSLPLEQRHVPASQRPCLWLKGVTSWTLSHDGGLPEKEGKELSPADPASGRSWHSLLHCLSCFQLLGGAEGKRHGTERSQACRGSP